MARTVKRLKMRERNTCREERKEILHHDLLRWIFSQTGSLSDSASETSSKKSDACIKKKLHWNALEPPSKSASEFPFELFPQKLCHNPASEPTERFALNSASDSSSIKRRRENDKEREMLAPAMAEERKKEREMQAQAMAEERKKERERRRRMRWQKREKERERKRDQV